PPSGAHLPTPSEGPEGGPGAPGQRPERSPAARCFLLPPRPRAASSPSKCGRFPGSRPPEAASLSKPPPLAKTLRRPAAQVPQPLQQLSPSVPRPVPCDSRSQDQRRLFVRLQLAQGREERQWRGCQLQPEICAAFSGVVQGLLRLPNIFHFSQATFNLALTIFSHLLASVKVNKKLLHIIMVTSLRLAVKVNEEEELIPHVKDFIKHYGSGYSPSELLRMELAILDRLHWDLYLATPLDFLTLFHALVVLSWPQVMELLPQRNPSLHVASLTRQLQHCMAGHQLLQFKGSTLALVIITLELERLRPDCCTPISDLLKKAQVSMEQYVPCKELVRQQLRSF
uniref:Cyclin I family member 2 n=1 Tax=Oryctolagus cuniculus TaxID=9986 RepID=G1T2A5_RABIT